MTMGAPLVANVVEGRRELGEILVLGGRNFVPCEEILGERFGSLELRRGRRWPKAGQTELVEAIDDTGDQRRFGADDRQRDRFVLCECRKRLDVVGRDRDIANLVFPGRSGVAGRDQYLVDPGRLGAFPGQRVFASA